jgi:hypothetical protein
MNRRQHKPVLSAASLAAAVLMFAASFPPLSPAEAANPPRVQPQSCSRLKAEIGARNVWQTSFVGQRRGPFDRLESFHAAPCFRTQAACKAWLYWAQTDWDHYQYFNPCRKGIR